VSLLQAGVSGLVNQATNWLVEEHVPQRIGSAHPNIAPYGTAYETADGPPIVLAVGTDRQFEALCAVLGLSDLAASPNFATNEARVENRDALERVLQVRIQQFETDPLLEDLRAETIPCGIVRDMPAVFAQEAAEAQVLRPKEGPPGLRQTAFPPSGDADDLAPPPHYAEHTAAVLREHIGLSSDEIDALAACGTVEQAA
jgi:crotonobetainyl-CoA:carnitine CoA-transferase CaiB-like acyl-CoA transferase